MIWHTGRESYIDTCLRFCHCSVTLSMCQMCPASFSHTSLHNLTYWYILLYIIHTLYTALYDTYCIHCIYHTCTHCYILCYAVQRIYTHTLISSDVMTTPSHDLLLLHKDIHIIPVYTSPSAMPYIIIYHTYNKIQKQDRQQQTYGRRT